jgi:hypothetical protein
MRTLPDVAPNVAPPGGLAAAARTIRGGIEGSCRVRKPPVSSAET